MGLAEKSNQVPDIVSHLGFQLSKAFLWYLKFDSNMDNFV